MPDVSPAEIAANLSIEARNALWDASQVGRDLPEPEVAEELLGAGLFGQGDLSFILEVTDLGRAVAAELEKMK